MLDVFLDAVLLAGQHTTRAAVARSLRKCVAVLCYGSRGSIAAAIASAWRCCLFKRNTVLQRGRIRLSPSYVSVPHLPYIHCTYFPFPTLFGVSCQCNFESWPRGQISRDLMDKCGVNWLLKLHADQVFSYLATVPTKNLDWIFVDTWAFVHLYRKW